MAKHTLKVMGYFKDHGKMLINPIMYNDEKWLNILLKSCGVIPQDFIVCLAIFHHYA